MSSKLSTCFQISSSTLHPTSPKSMASLACLLLVLLSLGASHAATTTTTDPSADKRNNFFRYLAGGINIANASLDDIHDTARLKNRNLIYMETNMKKYIDPILNVEYLIPKYINLNQFDDAHNTMVTSKIYRTMNDLLPLINASDLSLRHSIEHFENRFQETTLANERVVNALSTIRYNELGASTTEGTNWFQNLNSSFVARVNALLSPNGANVTELFRNFTNDYGTHSVSDAAFGGILMLDTKISMNSSAATSDAAQQQLEKDMAQHISYLLKGNGTDPAAAKASDIFYTQIFFGANGTTPSSPVAFRTQVKWNRTISYVKLKPHSVLIKAYWPKNNGIDTVVAELQKIEAGHAFLYALKRWKAAFEVSIKSVFHDTATGYHDANHLMGYVNDFIKMKPYPDIHAHKNVYDKYLKEMFKWPLEYQIGLRGSLGGN